MVVKDYGTLREATYVLEVDTEHSSHVRLTIGDYPIRRSVFLTPVEIEKLTKQLLRWAIKEKNKE